MHASREWKICSNMLVEMPTELWDFCPTPLPSESFLSWFTRLAKANCADARTLYEEMKKDFPARDGDHNRNLSSLEDVETSPAAREDLIAALAPHLMISRETLQSIPVVPSSSKSYWDYLNAALKSPRYCPYCLESDETPYFRISWFRKPYLTCPIHQILLRETCPHCGSPVEFWNTGWKEDITRCPHCRLDLTKDVVGVFRVHDPSLCGEIVQVCEKSAFHSTRVDPFFFFRQLWKVISQESKHPRVIGNLGKLEPIPAETLLQAIQVGLKCIANDPQRLDSPFRRDAGKRDHTNPESLKRRGKRRDTQIELQGKALRRYVSAHFAKILTFLRDSGQPTTLPKIMPALGLSTAKWDRDAYNVIFRVLSRLARRGWVMKSKALKNNYTTYAITLEGELALEDGDQLNAFADLAEI